MPDKFSSYHDHYNVKKGLARKISRGEIIGFVGALDYDYDPATKTMTVNQEGAKIVQYIFNRYVCGVGTSTIERELEEMGVQIPPNQKHRIRQQLQALFEMKNMLGICCKVRHLQ